MCIGWQGLHELNAKVEGELRELDKAKDDFDTCKASKDDWKNKLRTSKKKAQDAGTPSPEIKDFWRTLPTNLEDLQEKTRLLESEADNLVGDKSVLQVGVSLKKYLCQARTEIRIISRCARYL
eukprot:SAG25_NODE_1152_length_3773_cov_2.382145_3_plen_123_part_00